MPRGSEALGDHFDLARNPVPDEQGICQLPDNSKLIGHKPRPADVFRRSLFGSVRFCIQLLLQIVDVGQSIVHCSSIATL